MSSAARLPEPWSFAGESHVESAPRSADCTASRNVCGGEASAASAAEAQEATEDDAVVAIEAAAEGLACGKRSVARRAHALAYSEQ